jgi:hypothetical protein
MFGKLVSTNNGERCHIETDPAALKGWEGESDLHVCAFVPTSTFLYIPKEYLKVSVRMMQEATTMTGHFKEFPRTLYEIKVTDETFHLVEALPGHEPPRPIVLESLGAYSVFPSNFGVTISFPKCNVTASTFTTRITFPSPLRDRKVDVSNVTPCTITITCGTETHKCNFPFPVHGAQAKVRVARKSGWIEVVAPLSTPNKGGYHCTPFPLLKADGELCNWNSPSTSFRIAPKLDLLKLSEQIREELSSGVQAFALVRHFRTMFSDVERRSRLDISETSDPRMIFRSSLQDLFVDLVNGSRVFEVKATDDSLSSLLFFIS